MSLLSKKPAAITTPAFTVPSLADVDPAYSDLLKKQRELLDEQSKRNSELREIESAILADTSPEVNPAVAALLGDEPDSKAMNRQRAREIRGQLSAIAAALDVLRQRIAVARSRASQAVVASVRPEYARRVKAMVSAFEQVHAARVEYQALLDQFEMEDISWSSLIPMTPAFLGDIRDGRIQQFFKEAREAGYHGN